MRQVRDQGRENAREGKFGERRAGKGALGSGAQRMLGGQRPKGRDGSPVIQLS